tara:strand:- start:674 stop:925 length:252 start_codon:yes stop_codon:yes gene_type:complete
MTIIFHNVLNSDLNYYIFRVLHKIQLNEVFNELFEKIYYKDFLDNIVKEYDCDYYITYKNGKFISTIHYPIHRNAIGCIVFLN